MILFSGDAISARWSRRCSGVRVTVVSSIASQPPMIADELRCQADIFTEPVELRAKVGRDPSERPPPRERSEMHSPQFLQRAPATRPGGTSLLQRPETSRSDWLGFLLGRDRTR